MITQRQELGDSVILVEGKYNRAKIFTDQVEPEALAQIRELCDQEFTRGSRIRIMPDVHAGIGCTIGTTMTITDKVVPNLVGVDIGCGMETIKLREKTIDFKKLDRVIYDHIPSGFDIRKKPHAYASHVNLRELYCKNHVDLDRAVKSVGTLGGGNHFIEVNRDEEGNLYLVVHSGSRHLGKQVAEYYQNLAYDTLRKKFINVSKPLAYLEGENYRKYLHDMQIVQQYAVYNRRAIVEEILSRLGLGVEDRFTTIHNYIDLKSMILRKGAISARRGERVLIPMNMRDGSLICLGKGNPDWNYSAPHGAGRLMSRRKAKEVITLAEFQRTMEGIYSTTVNKSTLDECALAYKPMEEIINHIQETVEIVSVIKPVYNFKAAE